MMYQLFFVLAMLLSLALLGLLVSAVWMVMAGSRLGVLRKKSQSGPEELSAYLERSSLFPSLARNVPDLDGDWRRAIADAAGRDRYLAELTAFSRNRTFRGAAFSLLALTGATGAALAASGLLGAGLVRALNGLLLFLVALTAWAILATLARIHHLYLRSFSVLSETMQGMGMETGPAGDASSARPIRIEHALFALFLLLMIARYFLLIFLRVNISSVTGFVISLGSFLLLCLALLASLGILNRRQRRKEGI